VALDGLAAAVAPADPVSGLQRSPGPRLTIAEEAKTSLESGLPDFSWYNIPKTGKYVPNCHKIYQIAVRC
jgi:hypothetical protein